jgi:RNA-binding motif X-linked protein 2
MNVTKEIQRINEREAALGLKASWHDEYANSPYVFVGNLDHGLTEGDIVAVFEQYTPLRLLQSLPSSLAGRDEPQIL